MSEYLSDLERMANQIALNFAADPSDEVAARIAEHLQKFWDPGMRRDLVDAVISGDVSVSATVRAAIDALSTSSRR
jgi:formate dehydrogenase subunit delta